MASRSEWTELARRTEANGYSTLTMPDHFDGQLAPVPALQCAADATSTLRLGALVYDNDYKHPVVLAKELATMDVLSDGRVEIGLGAGWMVTDYEQSGIPYDSPGVRVSRMIEGLAVIKGALGPDPFSFDGDHYTITDYNGLPKPVQSQPPVLIGGGGPRVLRFAAREADIVGINATLTSGAVDETTFASMTAEQIDRRCDRSRRRHRSGSAGRHRDEHPHLHGVRHRRRRRRTRHVDRIHRGARRGDRSVTVRAGRPAEQDHRRAAGEARPLGIQLRDRRPERHRPVRPRRRCPAGT